MDGFEIYRTYVAVKLHFTSESYDYVEKSGRTRVTQKSFENRRDRVFFDQVAREIPRGEILPFFVANFSLRPDAWIGDLTSMTDAQTVYREWRKRILTIAESVEYDLRNISEVVVREKGVSWAEVVWPTKGNFPGVMRMKRQGMIFPETFVFLDKEFQISERCDTMFSSDHVWRRERLLLHKYGRFLSDRLWSRVREASLHHVVEIQRSCASHDEEKTDVIDRRTPQEVPGTLQLNSLWISGT